MEALVVEVLRTPEIQRLRKIRQLGLVHYVFPGAEHSRFAHSLGSAYLALRFARQLQNEARELFIPALVPDESAIADLGLAALCHDLGHGPLSHAWEREIIGDSFDRGAWARALGLPNDAPWLTTAKWHEIVAHGFLAWEEGLLHKLLESHERGTSLRIRQLLAGTYYLPYFARLLNSDVDVDRADFIMRDTHQTGVAYGRFDLNWLISTCTIGEHREGTKTWAVGFDSRKAVRVIEQFLIARRALYDTVYYHKTVRCVEGMLAMLLRRLREIITQGYRPPVTELVTPMVAMIEGKTLEPRELLGLDDFAISVLVDSLASTSTKDDTVRDLARRIQARDLFKQVPLPSSKIADFLQQPGRQEQLYEAIEPYVAGPSKYYLIQDTPKFEMFATEPRQRAFLINPDRSAQYAMEHPAFLLYRQPTPPQVRLFTIREAVQAVVKAIVP